MMSPFNEEDQSRPRIKMHQKRKPQGQEAANSPHSSNQFNTTFNEEDQSPRSSIKIHQKRKPQKQVPANSPHSSNPFIKELLTSSFGYLNEKRTKIMPFIMGTLLIGVITNIFSSLVGNVFTLIIAIIILIICFMIFIIFQINPKLRDHLKIPLKNSKVVSIETIVYSICMVIFIAIIIFLLFNVKSCNFYNKPG